MKKEYFDNHTDSRHHLHHYKMNKPYYHHQQQQDDNDHNSDFNVSDISIRPSIKVIKLKDIEDKEDLKGVSLTPLTLAPLPLLEQSSSYNSNNALKNKRYQLKDNTSSSILTSSYDLPLSKDNSNSSDVDYLVNVLPKKTPLSRLIAIDEDKSDYSHSVREAHRKGMACSFQKDQNFSTFCHYLSLLSKKNDHDNSDDSDSGDDNNSDRHDDNKHYVSSSNRSNSNSSRSNSISSEEVDKIVNENSDYFSSSLYIQKRAASSILNEILSSIDVCTARYLAKIIYDKWGSSHLYKCWAIFPNEITRDIVNSRSHLLFDSSHSSTPIGFYICSDIALEMPHSFSSVSGVIYSGDSFSQISNYAKELGANLYNLDVDYSNYIDTYQYTDATQSEEEDTFTNIY